MSLIGLAFFSCPVTAQETKTDSRAQVEAISTTATKLEPPKNHGGFFAFAFAPDGKSVAGGTGVVWFTILGKKTTRGGEVVVWDAESGKLTTTLGTHDATVSWVQYPSNGSKLASISKDNGLFKLWDVSGGKAIQTISLGGAVYDGNGAKPLLSPDGATLVTVDQVEKETTQGKVKSKFLAPRRLTVWDIPGGKVRRTVDADTLRAMALSPDGKLLARSTAIGTYGEGGRSIAIEETHTGRALYTIPLDMKLNQYADLLVFLPDGKHLAGAGNRSLWIWKIDDGKLRIRLSLGDNTSLSRLGFSPDGKSALANAFMGEWAPLWDLTPGAERLQAELKLKDRLWHPQFSSDLSRIACHQGTTPVILRLQRP